MTDFAKSFEDLLTINQVTGKGENYKRLEEAERIYNQELQNIENNQPRKSNISIDKYAFSYGYFCQRVWDILEPAIKVGISNYRDVFSKSEIQEMEKSINIEGIVLNKEFIDDVIATTEKIYAKHNIYPA
jgi:hypothetical protein